MADKITVNTEISPTELACILGLTARHIRRLAEDGLLEKTQKGRYALCASVQRYIDSKGMMTDDDVQFDKEKKSAEIILKTAKAKIAKLEADELEGKMHRSEDVAAMTEDLVYTIRGSLMALPGRLAVDVVEAATPAEAAEIIRKEVYAIMRELANYEYDPKKYEERVRARMDWDMDVGDSDDK